MHTKKRGRRSDFWYDYVCPHQKEKNDTNDVTTGYFFRKIIMIDISGRFKQVSLPRDFAQTNLRNVMVKVPEN
jgi:hypothetical protein